MTYRYLITGVLHGALVGIGLSVGTYLSDASVGVAFIKIGLGVAAGLLLAGYASVQEIRRTEEILRSHPARGNHTYLFQTSTNQREATKRSQMIAGLSPLPGMAVTLFPFTFQGVLLTPFVATLSAVTLSTSFLFVFGSWLGLATHRRWYIVGVRLASFGLLAAGVNVILP